MGGHGSVAAAGAGAPKTIEQQQLEHALAESRALQDAAEAEERAALQLSEEDQMYCITRGITASAFLAEKKAATAGAGAAAAPQPVFDLSSLLGGGAAAAPGKRSKKQ